MTAKQEKVDIRYGMQLGADDYITKPFERNELLSAVRTRLARRAVLLEEGNRKERDLRSQLLRMIPHELRTPLVGILGIGELLGQDAQSLTPAEITDYAAMITTSGRQLYRLVENHLLYTQLIMDAEDPQWVQMTEDATVHQIIPLIHNVSEEIAQAYKRADHLQMDLQPATVHVTREHLSKIVYELVDNAFKFSKAPASVKVLGQVRADQYLLTITDQGRGLTPEQTNQIAAYVQFERQKHEQPGVGLGLTLARLLAELYGGGLQLKSTPGIGTAIQVTLRLT